MVDLLINNYEMYGIALVFYQKRGCKVKNNSTVYININTHSILSDVGFECLEGYWQFEHACKEVFLIYLFVKIKRSRGMGYHFVRFFHSTSSLLWLRVGVWVFKATFNSIIVISWELGIFVKELEENHYSAADMFYHMKYI